ncbi:Zn-dependent exopeptidase M28 [Candidatus Thorarchaeota archaeon]|nr:MAG: Zn-dependent exopeptidase M28 [Candidatus Thorarchaeota archaeon]
MKRNLVLALFILILVVFPFPVQRSEVSDETEVVSVAELAPQRIYGQDISHLIWSQVTVDSFRDYIITLTENGSRWIQDPGLASWQNTATREYILAELERVSNGRIETEVIGDWQSVVGRLPGYLPVEAPAFLIGGHYDSVPAAPGANDDGTGVATMLELARVMSQYSWPLDIYFGAWNAEEIGLFGSAEVAREFQTRGIELIAHYNIDMLLVPDPEDPTFLMVHPVGYYHEGQYWADLTKMMSMQYGSNLSVPVMASDFSAWQRSDHWSFIQRGFGTSLFVHESGFAYDNAYHTSRDVWHNEMYDYEVATEAVKSIGAAIAFTMSRAYQQLIQLEFSFTLIPSHTKTYFVPISMPTAIEVACRWFGGGTSFRLSDPEGEPVAVFATMDSSPWEATTVLNEDVTQHGIYTLEVFNIGGTSTGHELTISYDSDVDGNDVPDSQEFWFDQSYFSSDLDNDNISDAEEMILGTSMNSSDSDMDSLPDQWEVANNLDPLDPGDASLDHDQDGLVNTEEMEHNCDPWSADSDSDGIPDFWEVLNALDPTTNDAAEDPDGDGVSNLNEYLNDTDPNFPEPRGQWILLPVLTTAVAAIVVVILFIKRRHWPEI